MSRIIKRGILILLIIVLTAGAGIAIWLVRDNRSISTFSDSTPVQKGFAVLSGGYTYYCNPEDGGKIYKIKNNKTSKEKICSDSTDSIFIEGDWIFYSNKSDGKRIYRIRTDGSGRKKITKDGADYINLAGSTIYYSDTDKNYMLYSVNVNGGSIKKIGDEYSAYVNIASGYIYYINHEGKIVKIEKDGTGKKILDQGKSIFLTLLNNKIYFSNVQDNCLYGMDTNGSNREKLSSAYAYNMIPYKNMIYFTNLGLKENGFDSNYIYSVDTDNGNLSKVSTEPVLGLCTSENTIFYKTSDGRSIYKSLPDGSARQAIDGRTKADTVDEICNEIRSRIDFEINNKKMSAAYDRAKTIIASIIKPGMTDVQKELTVHDYIIKNTRYDDKAFDALKKENAIIDIDSHEAWGVLNDGIGVCDGYASAAKLLLTMSGIQCDVVDGIATDGQASSGNERPNHEWNIVKINGQYYQLDVTFDDNTEDETDMIGYNFFNLSDSAMARTHTWNHEIYPKCESEEYNFLKNAELAVRDGDHIYYINTSGNLSIYSINLNDGKKYRLNITRSLYLSLNDGWIYYSNYDDGGYLYKMKEDGTDQTRINNDWSINIFAKDGWVEYVNKNNNIKYRINTDGTLKQRL